MDAAVSAPLDSTSFSITTARTSTRRQAPGSLATRFHLHFTPTYASCRNQGERWFALITQRAIRGGWFSKVRQLVERIEQFVTHYNKDRPLVSLDRKRSTVFSRRSIA